MDLRPLSLLFAAGLVTGLTLAGLGASWLQNRSETVLLWIAAACGTGCAGLALFTLGAHPGGAVAGGFLLLLALGMVANGCAQPRGTSLISLLAAMPALVWLAIGLLPGFNNRPLIAPFTACMLGLIPLGLGLHELHLPQRERPLARVWLMGTLILQMLALALAAGALLAPELPNLTGVWSPRFTPQMGTAALLIDGLCMVPLLCFGALIITGERAEARYRSAARLDPLTGIGNRRHFQECLQGQLRLAYQTNKPLTLIMIDADHFKDFNDLYGHPAGDACLCELATAISSACRPTDVVARYGGEEFAVLLPDTDQRDATAIAERMRNRVRRMHVRHAARPDGIMTISLGAASLVPSRLQASPEDLLKAADTALYIAKNEGRDRTCWGSVRPAAIAARLDEAAIKAGADPATPLLDRSPSRQNASIATDSVIS